MNLSSKTIYLQQKVNQIQDYLYKTELELEKHLRIDVMSHIYPYGIGSKVKINALGEVGYLYGVFSDNTITPQLTIGRLLNSGEKSKRLYAKSFMLEDVTFID